MKTSNKNSSESQQNFKLKSDERKNRKVNEISRSTLMLTSLSSSSSLCRVVRHPNDLNDKKFIDKGKIILSKFTLYILWHSHKSHTIFNSLLFFDVKNKTYNSLFLFSVWLLDSL